jgi:predicted dehydrogenase
MSKTTVNWGILSTARIAHTFAKDIAYCESAKLVAVGSRHLDSAQEFAAAHGIPHAYGSYEDLLNDPHIDAIYIATPHTLHADNAIAALKAGKHVLCEKPATTSLEELERIISVAKTEDRFFMEAMWTYFLPAINEALAWVNAGRIGKLLHVKASFGFTMPYSATSREYARELGGGCLLDMGIYPIALDALFNTDDTYPAVLHSDVAPNGADNDVLWMYRYNEVVSLLHSSFKSNLGNDALLMGTEGTIKIPDFWKATECILYKGLEVEAHFSDERKGSGFEFEISHASEHILSKTHESDVMPFSVSRRFQERLRGVSENMKR